MIHRHIDFPDFEPRAHYETIGFYVFENGGYDEPNSPLGFRSTLLEAEALRHFVAENRCYRIRWYPDQKPVLDVWSFDIIPIQVPVTLSIISTPNEI